MKTKAKQYLNKTTFNFATLLSRNLNTNADASKFPIVTFWLKTPIIYYKYNLGNCGRATTKGPETDLSGSVHFLHLFAIRVHSN